MTRAPGNPADPGSGPPRCSCGATHRVPIEAIVIAGGAFERLGAFVRARRWSNPLVVMDANTAEAAGTRVVQELASGGTRAATLCFPERHGLLANEASVDRLDDVLSRTAADSLIAVGSGVITDITRYVAHRAGREFASVPTAASMDGYASGVAAMEFRGMKATFPAACPVAIFADPETVAAAPPDMTRSGLGDLLGKATARVDWLLAHALYGERYCAEVEARVVGTVVETASRVDEILDRSPQAVPLLLSGLVESGVAMAMVGSSRPASGCEHHASHFWDLLAAQGHRPHGPHGLQVGYATHFAMRLQRFALDGSVAKLTAPRPVPDGAEAGAPGSWFAGHGAEVRAVMDEKRRFASDHESAWPRTAAAWRAARAQAGTAMDLFGLVTAALDAARIPAEPGFLGLDRATLETTFRVANRIRARYTVLDFLEGQDRLGEAVEAALA